MLLRKGQLPIFITNIIALLLFGFVFWNKQNYEFLMYIGVITFLIVVILISDKKVSYPNALLWSLTVWSILHMAGGSITVAGDVLYAYIILPLVGAPYYILKYDQVVHLYGFCVATILAYYLLKPLLKQPVHKWISLGIVVVMAGLGIGALNEIIEFVATIVAPSTNVGGYENTLLDLVFNLVGALIAMAYVFWKENYSNSKIIGK